MFKDVRIIAALITTLVLTAVIILGGQRVLSWREAAHQNEQRGRTMQAASGIIADADTSAAARADADTGTARARGTFETTTEEDRQREPETAARDSGRVPDSRLRAFEQRRLARERLANDRLRRAGVEREEGPRSKDSSKR